MARRAVDAANKRPLKALVTGFEPFGGDEVDPSSLAVDRLKKKYGSLVVHTATLPCSFARSTRVLQDAIAKAKPDIVLCVGLAGGRSELCLERVGMDVQDARIRDNDGKQPIDKPVVKGGPRRTSDPADQGLRGDDAPGGSPPRCRTPPARSSATTSSTP